jgi:hypothetical protein
MLQMPVECWTRTVGYYRPINQMNIGKQSEVSERTTFNINDSQYDYLKEKPAN